MLKYELLVHEAYVSWTTRLTCCPGQALMYSAAMKKLNTKTDRMTLAPLENSSLGSVRGGETSLTSVAASIGSAVTTTSTSTTTTTTTSSGGLGRGGKYSDQVFDLSTHQ